MDFLKDKKKLILFAIIETLVIAVLVLLFLANKDRIFAPKIENEQQIINEETVPQEVVPEKTTPVRIIKPEDEDSVPNSDIKVPEIG